MKLLKKPYFIISAVLVREDEVVVIQFHEIYNPSKNAVMHGGMIHQMTLRGDPCILVYLLIDILKGFRKFNFFKTYLFLLANSKMADAFLWAIKNGDLEEVKKLVATEGVNVNNEISGGRCPLHFASDYGQLAVCEHLLEKGAIVDQLDKHGITPLLAAIWEDHIDVCKFLIAKGANKKGSTPDGVGYFYSTENKDIKDLLK